MKRVRDLLEFKGRDIWSIAPDDNVYNAIAKLSEKGIGALLVMDDDKLVGIVSERDYARRVILQGKSSKATPVKEIMTPDVSSVTESESVEECMTLMTNKRIRHLPVIEDNRVVGVLSIGDIVQAIISDRETTIEQLKGYIST